VGTVLNVVASVVRMQLYEVVKGVNPFFDYSHPDLTAGDLSADRHRAHGVDALNAFRCNHCPITSNH
jgi:hypothetical protein